jgi:hypothetical protein
MVMKSTVNKLAVVIVAIILGTACTKKEITPATTVKDIALEASLKTGETYNLDLSAYGSKNTYATIARQPMYASESVLTNGTCHTSGNYRYTAGSTAASDQVVLRLVKGGKCDQSGEMTNLTITIKTTTETPVTDK